MIPIEINYLYVLIKTRRIHKDKQIRFLRDNDLEDKGLISIGREIP